MPVSSVLEKSSTCARGSSGSASGNARMTDPLFAGSISSVSGEKAVYVAPPSVDVATRR